MMSRDCRCSRGRYVYCVDGQTAELEETWEIIERGRERITRSSRRVPARRTSLNVESIHRDGDWAQCDLDWLDAESDGKVRLTAGYRFDDNGIKVRLTGPAGDVESLRADADSIFSPLLRIYAGEVIHRLCRCSHGRVLVPWVGDTGGPRRLLRPQYSERQARPVGEDRLAVDGVPRNCVEYDYSGGPYVAGARFWVHESGVLLRYLWQQGDGREWDVRLQDWQTGTRPV